MPTRRFPRRREAEGTVGVEGTRGKLPVALRYAGENGFWEELGRRLKERNTVRCPDLFSALVSRAAGLGLPVTFGGPRSEAWALICGLFMLCHDRTPPLGRNAYRSMMAGCNRVMNGRSSAAAFGRIAANIASPSSPGRSIPDSVVDTFLANGLVTTGGYEGPSMDGDILTAFLEDDETMNLARAVVTPPDDVWDEALRSYESRRPGFAARKLLDLFYWIFTR